MILILPPDEWFVFALYISFEFSVILTGAPAHPAAAIVAKVVTREKPQT
jgi:hypothetical protein